MSNFRKIVLFFSGSLVGAVAVGALAVFLYFANYQREKFVDIIHTLMVKETKMTVLKTLEPLIISPNDDVQEITQQQKKIPYYVLPVGTHLHVDQAFGEGNVIYHVYFTHKGSLKTEDVTNVKEYHYDNHGRVPLWLGNIEQYQLKEILKQFPLKKNDVKAAIDANELTRDDLIEILLAALPE